MTDDAWTLGNLVSLKARTHGARPFLRFRDRIVSSQELEMRANQVAQGVAQLGVRKGDRVALLSENNPELIFAELGLTKLGALCIPVNIHLKPDELRYVLGHAGISLIIVQARYFSQVANLPPSIASAAHCVIIDGDSTERVGHAFESLLQGSAEAPNAEVGYADPACVLYTSGTTGLPKGVVYEHYGLVPQHQETYMQQIVEAAGYGAADVIYLPFPLYHILGQSHLIGALRNDCQLALAERFSASHFWADVSRYRATVLVHQGASIPILLGQAPAAEERGHVARVSLGAGVPNLAAWRTFEERFQVRIFEYYASTEGTFFGGGTVPTNHGGSVGRAYPTAEVRLVDENEHEVTEGVAGEFWCRLRPPHARKTPEALYYQEPVAGRERFTSDGWFRTGDLLRRDAAGFYYYVGKLETLIRCRGENVSPIEVENVVNAHPSIRESVAVGVPNEAMGGEEVKVVVVLQPGTMLDPAELVAWCDDRLAYFKVPRYVEVHESELLKTENTKRPLRRMYREQGVSVRTWDRLRAGVRVARERERSATNADSSRSAS